MTIAIDNFSLGVNEWLPTIDLGYYSVDVTDSTYGIITSGTYFIHDGQIVATTYSGITNGYRCYYTPASFYASGVINLVIHAENGISETQEQLFHLLYGYNCRFNEIIDWGPKQEVVFTIEAKNLAFCPNMEGEAFYFETAELQSVGLNATIRAIESVGLNATLYPQNTFFFYGRTYSITVSGIRDFAGNELAPYVFTFTIEDPTN